MTKVMSLLLCVSLVVLFVGIVFFQTILQVFFPLPAREIAREVARPKSETSGLDGTQAKGPSSDILSTREKPIATSGSQKTQPPSKQLRDAQGHREELAYKESLQSTERLPANRELTEVEQRQLEQQRLFEEQAEQEAAAYEESLQSSSFAVPKR